MRINCSFLIFFQTFIRLHFLCMSLLSIFSVKRGEETKGVALKERYENTVNTDLGYQHERTPQTKIETIHYLVEKGV